MPTGHGPAVPSPISRRRFTAGAGLLAGTAGALLAGTRPAAAATWIGDPNAVLSPDNPYLGVAEGLVTAILDGLAKDPPVLPDANGTFWLAWAASAPESTRRNNADVVQKALDFTETLTTKVNTWFWDILPALECVRLLRDAGHATAAQVSTWLGRLEPWVQGNYDTNAKGTDWWCFAPNTLHQSATILELGHQMIGNAAWSTMAASLIGRTEPTQRADGAFPYIRQSGPTSVYYGFDSTFLGRYYQLTQSAKARAMLVKLAEWSHDVLKNGLIEGSSAPWWKHVWNTDGPFHGPDIPAGVAGHALSRSVGQYRITQKQRFYYTYVPMYFWDGSLSSTVELGANLTRNNSNIGGPQMRRSSWQVVMPGRAYADTAIGATVATGATKFGWQGYLEVAALPVLSSPEGDPYAGNGSLLVLAAEETGLRSAMVTNEVIAVGATFQPRYPFHGDAVAPAPQGWALDQAWIATSQFLAGWMVVRATATKDSGGGPRGLVKLGHTVTEVQPDLRQFRSGDLRGRVHGSQVGGIVPTARSVSVDLVGAGGRRYTDGERFGYGLSLVTVSGGGLTPTVTLGSNAGGLLQFTVQPGTGARWQVIFNPSDRALSVSQSTFAGADQILRSGRNPELPSRQSGAPGNDVVVGSRSLVLARMGR